MQEILKGMKVKDKEIIEKFGTDGELVLNLMRASYEAGYLAHLRLMNKALESENIFIPANASVNSRIILNNIKPI